MISNLFRQHEPDNPHDAHAVAVKRVQGQEGKQEIVGHVPLSLLRVFHLFLNHGQISVEFTSKWRNKGVGLEIPATYTFLIPQEAFKNKKVNRTNKRQRG